MKSMRKIKIRKNGLRSIEIDVAINDFVFVFDNQDGSYFFEYDVIFFIDGIKVESRLFEYLCEYYGEEIEGQIQKICNEIYDAKYYDSDREDYIASRI